MNSDESVSFLFHARRTTEVSGLTVQKTTKMKALQILPLSHKAVQWGCPAFCQNLHPLHIHLVNETGKESFLFMHLGTKAVMTSRSLILKAMETNTSRMIIDYTNLIKIKGTRKMCISPNKCE